MDKDLFVKIMEDITKNTISGKDSSIQFPI